jgi:hypothetical protein
MNKQKAIDARRRKKAKRAGQMQKASEAQRMPRERTPSGRARPETAEEARKTAIDARKRHYGMTEEEAAQPMPYPILARQHNRALSSARLIDAARIGGMIVGSYMASIGAPGRAGQAFEHVRGKSVADTHAFDAKARAAYREMATAIASPMGMSALHDLVQDDVIAGAHRQEALRKALVAIADWRGLPYDHETKARQSEAAE